MLAEQRLGGFKIKVPCWQRLYAEQMLDLLKVGKALWVEELSRVDLVDVQQQIREVVDLSGGKASGTEIERRETKISLVSKDSCKNIVLTLRYHALICDCARGNDT